MGYFFIFLLHNKLVINDNPKFDLLLGRWALDMDQQILFDHLKRIFHFDSKEQLFDLIYKGGWPNYGPIFF